MAAITCPLPTPWPGPQLSQSSMGRPGTQFPAPVPLPLAQRTAQSPHHKCLGPCPCLEGQTGPGVPTLSTSLALPSLHTLTWAGLFQDHLWHQMCLPHVTPHSPVCSPAKASSQSSSLPLPREMNVGPEGHSGILPCLLPTITFLPPSPPSLFPTPLVTPAGLGTLKLSGRLSPGSESEPVRRALRECKAETPQRRVTCPGHTTSCKEPPWLATTAGSWGRGAPRDG